MDIYLREIRRSDIPAINCWRNNRILIDSLAAPFRFINQEIDERWFEAYMASRSTNVRLAICEAETCQLIGVVYLLQIDWLTRSSEYAIQIGETASQGSGAGYQATVKTLEHAFGDLNLKRVYLTVLESNERAISLYQKIGFVEEGKLRKAAFKNGRYADLIQMSILKEEFDAS